MKTEPSEPPLRVAYQGGPGCNSERAGLTLLHDAFFGWPFASFAEAAANLASGQVDLAILPVHNSSTGDIAPALRSIRLWKLVALEEITLRIEHWLMAAPGWRMADLREVMAHPQVIAQCGRWLAGCGLAVQAVDDGARQVAQAVRFRSGAAILGPKGIGEATGLYCLAGPLQDDPENRTRFRLLARADGRAQHIKRQLARAGA
ncbi:MAG: prephenate dehydratase [Planctomycetes bacterium]|nr:prephenate dehydratase [Planctomycetota bacterium]